MYLNYETAAETINRLRKYSLNSDGQQFHQYQQNEQSLLISNHYI
jgi:hypothetical protein